MGKRNFFLPRILFVLLAIAATTPSYAIMLDVLPSSTTVTAGNSFNVDIVVSGLHDSDPYEIVSAYDIFVGFDSTIIDIAGVSFSSWLNDGIPGLSISGTNTSTPGQVEVWEVSFLPDAYLDTLQPDTIVLATLTFDALAEGVSSLNFLPHPNPNFGFQDVKGRGAQVLQLAATGGRVTVNAPSPIPAPSTILLLLAGLLTMGRRRFAPRGMPV